MNVCQPLFIALVVRSELVQLVENLGHLGCNKLNLHMAKNFALISKQLKKGTQ